MKKVISLIVLLTLSILVASAPAAQNIGSGPSPGARISISADELLDANFVPPKPTYNLSFMPAAGEESAIQQFQGELEVTAIDMKTYPEKLKAEVILNMKPRLFPGFKVELFSHNGALVPVQREIINPEPDLKKDSWWEIIIDPGKVWSEKGDKGWSRASFPFTLVNSMENESYNGLATFLYKDGQISGLRFQKLTQTTPWYVETYFVGWGQAKAKYTPKKIADLEGLKQAYDKELDGKIPTASWGELATMVGEDKLAAINLGMKQDELVQNAFVYNGVMYVKPSMTAYGIFPYPMRHGVWSVTKSCGPALIMMRLAVKYGPEVYDLKIKDYVELTATHNGWDKVTFADALNMATGIANAENPTNDPKAGISVDYTYPKGYYAWYEAPTVKEKLAIISKCVPYEWGPGKVARYRDRTMFTLGVALNNFLKSKEGSDADVWEMLKKEVFAPIGIVAAPITRTREKDGSMGQIISSQGYLPTLDELAKITNLFHDGGMHNGKQLLYEPKAKSVLYSAEPKGLPTYRNDGGFDTGYYYHAFWYIPFEGPTGQRIYLPYMSGWGGVQILLMPDKMTLMRFSKAWSGLSYKAAKGMYPMAYFGNWVAPFVK